MNRRDAEARRIHLCVSVFICGSLCLAGCAQNTEAPVGQITEQESVTPTTTEQEAATQGSQVNVWVINAPGEAGLPNPQSFSINTEEGISAVNERERKPDGTETETSNAGYAQNGITINITTGGTIPSLTGTTTATASAAQTPTAYPTATPTQRVEPDIGLSVPIAIAPGGGNVIDQASAATGGGGTTTQNKTSENDLRWSTVRAAAEQFPGLLELLEEFFGLKASTTTQTGD